MRLFLILLILPFVLNATELPVAERPVPGVGDVYEYNFPNAPFRCRRWQIVELAHDGMMVSQCGPFRSYQSVVGDYNPVRLSDGGNDLWSFSPYFPGVKFPLQLVATWNGDYDGFTADMGMHWRGEVSCDVGAFEPVAVPAGTFNAYRIECTDQLQSAPSRQPMGVVHSIRWYAPLEEVIAKVWNREDPRWNAELAAIER